MHIEVRTAGDVLIVDLSGKLVAGLGDQMLRETIDELLAEGRNKILLNLSAITFLDSAGVGELVAGLRTAQRLGGDLRLLAANSKIQSTLKVARLLPVFRVYEDEKVALREFFDSGSERG